MTRWLYPVQEGSELWGKTTKQPTATRVHGVKTDDEARLVAAAFEPQISHFHQAQAGQRALGGLPTYKTRSQPVPGLQLAYTYNNGLEYLDVTVSPGLLEQLGIGPEDFWDYALVELLVPDMHYDQNAVELFCYAQLSSPSEGTLAADSTLPFPGVASITDSRTSVDPIINAATKAPPGVQLTATSPSGSECCASFTVDLRQARGGAAVVDLYPYIYVNSGLPTPHIMGVGSVSIFSDSSLTFVDSDWDTEYGDVLNPACTTFSDILNPPSLSGELARTYEVENNGGIVGWTMVPGTQLSHSYADIAEFHYVPLPAIHFDEGSHTWKFDATDDYFYVQDYGHQTASFIADAGTGALISQSYDNTYQWWRYWKLIQTGTDRTYTGPDPIPATLRATMFKGVPQLIGTAFTPGLNPTYDRWTTSSGGIVAPMVSVAVDVPTYTNDQAAAHPNSTKLSHFYGIPKLGSVTIDTRRIIKPRPEILTIASFKKA